MTVAARGRSNNRAISPATDIGTLVSKHDGISYYSHQTAMNYMHPLNVSKSKNRTYVRFHNKW